MKTKAKIYKVNGLTYIFKSKYDVLNNLYGLSDEDIKEVDNKLKKQKKFLEDSFVFVDGEKKKSLLELSYGANINPDIYFSELNNRVNTSMFYAEDINFNCSLFVTIKPKSKHKPLKVVKHPHKKDTYFVVDNSKFNGNPEYVKESRQHISDELRGFRSSRIFKDIKKEFGHNVVYFGAYEPHLDGSCHKHLIFNIPEKYKDRFIANIKSYFYFADVKSDLDKKALSLIL